MQINSKLPKVGTNIFTVMSGLANEQQAINLSQGFPNFESSARLIDLVHSYMQRGMNQYAPMQGVPALRQRLAEKIDTLYQLNVDPDTEITITAGATQALYCAITAFVSQGDEVIILEPAYDSYKPAIELNGGVAVPFELQAPDFRIDWQMLHTLTTPRTRMIITNNPHNPTGQVWSHDDMLLLQDFAEQHDLIVLSDEVYEHLVYDQLPHLSAFLYPQLYARTLAIFSFGKTFHNTGWKIGYVVAPPTLSAEFRKVHQFNVFSVNTPIQHALATFLADPAEYLQLNAFYQQKRDFFMQYMSQSRFVPISCQGTYFQLFDYSHISDELDLAFAQRITRQYKVASIPVSAFYASGRDERVIRLCFAKTEETLARAGEILASI